MQLRLSRVESETTQVSYHKYNVISFYSCGYCINYPVDREEGPEKQAQQIAVRCVRLNGERQTATVKTEVKETDGEKGQQSRRQGSARHVSCHSECEWHEERLLQATVVFLVSVYT